jgi:hypothetical protein
MLDRRVTFVLLYDKFNKLDIDFDSHESDFEDSPNLEEEDELDLKEELVLFKDNNPESKPKDGNFVDIDEYL